MVFFLFLGINLEEFDLPREITYILQVCERWVQNTLIVDSSYKNIYPACVRIANMLFCSLQNSAIYTHVGYLCMSL